MKLKPCRDCGTPVPSDARGCPKCARNLEAERMLARYFWGGLSILVLAIVFAIYFIYSNR
jgi:RNA polymerase subunit RPABC4/transcription elongation factor Spt4